MTTNAKISVAKALKLKNRLAGRLGKVQQDISAYNSVLKEQVGKVNVENLIKLHDQIQESLIGLKTQIILTNAPIQETLIRMGEAKAKLSFLDCIPVRDGQERHGYQNTEVTWVATLTKQHLDVEKRKLEKEIDTAQDVVDSFNHVTLLEIPQMYLDLAS